MHRLIGGLILVLLMSACATAPMPGSPIASASACMAAPLDFSINDQRALHACPYSPGAAELEFAEVENGVVRTVMDEDGARDWVKAARCTLPGLPASAAASADAMCEGLVADLFGLWRTAGIAEARAQRAEAALVRTRLQANVWRSSDPFVGDTWGW